MARNHDKKTLANEYCLCRRIPHRWVGNEQLLIGDAAMGYDVIYSIYNIPYVEIVRVIDNMCNYNSAGYFVGLEKNLKFT